MYVDGISLSIWLIFLAGLQTVHPWSGHVCTRSVFKGYRREQDYCWYRIGDWCSHWQYLTRGYFGYEKYCCRGWTTSAYRVCNTPVCNPRCKNGGTCIAPNVCTCRAGFDGVTCEGTSACSHRSPCYPGSCSSSGQCVCSNGFTGDKCLTFQGESYKAEIKKVNATFSKYSDTKKEYDYYFMTDATGKTEVDYIWINQEEFNTMNFDIDAFIDSKYAFRLLPRQPNYIRAYKFGIVDARVKVEHYKLGFGVVNREEFSCQQVSNRNPKANSLLECRLHNRTNIIQMDSGDKYTLKCTVKTGGYRVLINPYPPYHTQETYSGVSIQKDMEYRFDYDVPEHCKESNTCGRDEVPLKLDKDISRGPFKAFWKGWKDNLSGIKRYALEFWKMEYSKDYDGLREPDILMNYNPVPHYIVEVDEKKTIDYPEYQPIAPGVYSVILEVADAANNSRYARQIVMYDDTSEIFLDENYRLYAMSASPKADHVWQTNYDDYTTTTIKITWKNRFINKLHHNNHFLSKILDYMPRLSDNIKRVDYKKIDPQFDDTDSVRNKSAIHNINAIIQFETVHGVQSTRPPTGWQIVNPLREDATFDLTGVNIRSGDSYQVWVRAHDFMGNTKTDSVVIYFDSSAPNVLEPIFQRNVKDGIYAFSSRVTLYAKDEQSGIAMVSFKFIVNHTGEITEQRAFEKEKETKLQCDSNPKECYCIPKGDCFLIDTVLDIDNCWLKVPLDRVKDEIHRLDITVYNMAMIPTTTTYNIGFVDGLRGIRDYFGPSNITIHKPTDSSLTISWVQAPTCYERIGILLRLFKPDNSTEDRKVHKDAITYDLTGLQATTKYRFQLFTKYGNESHPVTSMASADVQFTTTEKHVGITPGTIAGISGGFVLLMILVIVLCYLARTGRLQRAKERVTQGIRTIRNRVCERNVYGGGNEEEDTTSHAEPAEIGELKAIQPMRTGGKKNKKRETTDQTQIDEDLEETICQSSKLLDQVHAKLAGPQDGRSLERQKWGQWMASIFPDIDEMLWNRFKRDSMHLMERYQGDSAELRRRNRQHLSQPQDILSNQSVQQGVYDISNNCGASSGQGYLPTLQHQYQMPGQDYIFSQTRTSPNLGRVQIKSPASTSNGAPPRDLSRSHSATDVTTSVVGTAICAPTRTKSSDSLSVKEPLMAETMF